MEIRPDDYLRAMAFHEAGHAVVAWSLNLRVERIQIREIGAGSSATQTHPPDHLSLIDRLATLAAGLEAELAFNCPLYEHAGDRDRPMAIAVLREHHEDLASDEIQSHLAAGQARARELLLEHRERVVQSECLLDVRRIDEAEFLALMSA